MILPPPLLLILFVTSCLKLRILPAVTATSSLFLYSGSNCSDPNPIQVMGTDAGLCQQITAQFWTFQVAQIDPNCAITVYANDNAYCGLGRKYALAPGQCYGYDTINQFTVDCQASNITAPANSTAAAAGDRNLDQSQGLSTSDKIILAVTIPVSVVVFLMIAIFGWGWWRRQRQHAQLSSGWGRRCGRNKDPGLLIPDFPELHNDEEKHSELEDQYWHRRNISGRSSAESAQTGDHMSPVELEAATPLRQKQDEDAQQRRSWIDPQRWSWVKSSTSGDDKRASWI